MLDKPLRPQDAGLDPSRLERISGWMQRYVETGRFPFAATLIARRGHLVWQNHCGLADIAAARPYAPDDLVRIYSMTKPLTSIALMMLYEEALVHLDDPVSAFIPEFADLKVLVPGAERIDQTEPLAEPLRLHHLLTHTAGLTYQFQDDVLAKSYAADKVDFWPQSGGLAATVARLVRQPLLFQPGTRWNYSVATDVVGRIVEIVSGVKPRSLLPGAHPRPARHGRHPFRRARKKAAATRPLLHAVARSQVRGIPHRFR